MVRLKDTAVTGTNVTYLFQFQYGAIESIQSLSILRSATRFQFQYGAIESHYLSFHNLIFYGFQFQYGAIERSFLLVV